MLKSGLHGSIAEVDVGQTAKVAAPSMLNLTQLTLTADGVSLLLHPGRG